jgi:dienelactone hydrolase
LSDVFGLYNNSKLLADDFAANGYLTVIPDIFKDEALPLDALESGKVDLTSWGARHGPEQVDPVVESTIAYLRQDLGIKRIGGVGYCFGGKVRASFIPVPDKY